MATAAEICARSRPIRSDLYSDTFRAVFTLRGVKQEWDIRHIGIPFDPRKEIALEARFGIAGARRLDFYRDFGNNLRNQDAVLRALEAAGDPALDRSTLYIRSTSLVRRPGDSGSDVYLITRPAQPLTDSPVIRGGASTLHNLLNLGIRLLQMLKAAHGYGFCFGALDLDSFYTAEEGGRLMIKNGSFLFASGPVKTAAVLTPDSHAFLPDPVRRGLQPVSPDSDVRVLCALLWSLLDGRAHTEPPDLSRPPRYAPPELVRALEEGLELGAGARQRLNRVLRDTLKTAGDGLIRFREPEWSERLRAAEEEYLRYHPAALEEEEEDGEDPEEEDGGELEEEPTLLREPLSLRRKALLLAGAAAVSAAVMAASLYAGKAAGESYYGPVPAPIPAVSAQPEPEVAEAPEPRPSFTPMPVQTMTPIRDSEYPELLLDPDYDWFRSEHPPEDFCAVVFRDSYDHRQELLEKWSFRLRDSSVLCRVIERREDTGIPCGTEGGDKILILTGNGSGKLRVKMTQSELVEYLGYRFPHAAVSGLSVLLSTGSTPFRLPVPPVTAETPVPYAAEAPAETPEPAASAPAEHRETTAPAGHSDTRAYAYAPAAVITPVPAPDWDSGDWSAGGGWDVPSAAAPGYSVAGQGFALESDRTVCAPGETLRLRLAGEIDGEVRIWSSDPGVAAVTGAPDAAGSFPVTGVSPGAAEIFASCPRGTERLTVFVR